MPTLCITCQYAHSYNLHAITLILRLLHVFPIQLLIEHPVVLLFCYVEMRILQVVHHLM